MAPDDRKPRKNCTLKDDDIVTERRPSRRGFIGKISPIALGAVATVLGVHPAQAGDGTDSDRARLADPKLPRDTNNNSNDVAWNDDNTWQPSNLSDGDRFR